MTIDDQPWFVAADVYGAIGLRQWGGVLNPLDAEEKTLRGRASLGLPPGRPVWLISEGGLYKLILRSDKPEAKAFQNWVTRDVLPAIRKDGGYVFGEEKVKSGDMSEDELVERRPTSTAPGLGAAPNGAETPGFAGPVNFSHL